MQLCSRRRFCCHFLLQFATLDDAIAIYAASSRVFWRGRRRLAYTKALVLKRISNFSASDVAVCASASYRCDDEW